MSEQPAEIPRELWEKEALPGGRSVCLYCNRVTSVGLLRHPCTKALLAGMDNPSPEAREKILREAQDVIRKTCGACGGTGVGSYSGGGFHTVTHEMAMDAGDPSLEGTAIEQEPDAVECQYCGEPIQAIEAMIEESQ